jgi:hypothetical protein
MLVIDEVDNSNNEGRRTDKLLAVLKGVVQLSNAKHDT